MRIPRIFTQHPLSSGSTIELEEGASRHLLKALRLIEGAPLILFNGLGGEYSATISQTSKKVASVLITEFHDINRNSPLNTHLLIGISRGERFDFVLQKATELGVTEITPIFTERCEVKLKGERLEKKVESWRQTCISACEQCQRNILPKINQPQNLQQALSSVDQECKLVLHHRAAKALHEFDTQPSSVALLIGPEGGLSDSEIEQALQSDFKATLFGPRVLRTETAPLVALSLLQARWGDY